MKKLLKVSIIFIISGQIWVDWCRQCNKTKRNLNSWQLKFVIDTMGILDIDINQYTMFYVYIFVYTRFYMKCI